MSVSLRSFSKIWTLVSDSPREAAREKREFCERAPRRGGGQWGEELSSVFLSALLAWSFLTK